MNSQSGQPDVAPLFETMLDSDGLEALVRDIEAGAVLVDVRTRPSIEVSLRDIPNVMRDGSVRSAQIRYRHEEEQWCDTILSHPNGFRVIRIAQPQEPA